jgi:VanZ family protein
MFAKAQEWNEKNIAGRAAKISDVIAALWGAANGEL